MTGWIEKAFKPKGPGLPCQLSASSAGSASSAVRLRLRLLRLRLLLLRKSTTLRSTALE